jgi:Fe-S oxidoreductase
MPLGICYIASALEAKGHQVQIFDRYLYSADNSSERVNSDMLKTINQFLPDIIGFNTITPAIYDTIEAVKSARTIYSNMIVLGGHQVTAMPELTLQRITEADAVIVGEGELPFCMLVDGEKRDAIPGLYWREGDRILGNKNKGSIENIDLLQLPAYHLLNMDYYTKKNLATIRNFYLGVGSVLASRGCKNRCEYCTESLTYSGGVRYHNTDYITENIELLVRKYKCNGITFLDNDFLADRNKAEEILRKLIERKLNKDMRFCIQARVTGIDRDIALLMKLAGCCKVEFGLESADERILAKIKKNATVNEAEKAIKICNKNGISVQANLIMGFEGETMECLDRTFDWIKGLNIDNFKIAMLSLYPGSKLYADKGESFFENNLWTEENIDLFFKTDRLSAINQEERKECIKKMRFFNRYLHHSTLWKYNPTLLCLKYYYEAFLEKGWLK